MKYALSEHCFMHTLSCRIRWKKLHDGIFETLTPQSSQKNTSSSEHVISCVCQCAAQTFNRKLEFLHSPRSAKLRNETNLNFVHRIKYEVPREAKKCVTFGTLFTAMYFFLLQKCETAAKCIFIISDFKP